jgi:hypothetical protein
MNLAQVLHQRWAAAAGLSALLPAGRVFTGASPDGHRPFAIIGKRSHRPQSRFNDGSSFDAVVVRIEILDDEYDRAAAILAEVKAAFDRAAFDLAGAQRVLVMQRIDDFETQADDGTWRMTIDFECQVLVGGGIGD